MKPEYLTREVTINRKSFTELDARLATQRSAESSNVLFALSYVLCTGSLHAAVSAELFGRDDNGAKTFTGAEMLMALMASAKERIADTYAKAADGGCDARAEDAVITVAGIAMLHILDLMDELFGSDADGENPNAEVNGDA